MSMRTILTKTYVLFILLMVSGFLKAGELVFTINPINGKGEIIELSWAKVYLNGEEVDFVACDRNKGLVIKLQFDNDYEIKLDSKHFEPLNIRVDTHLPADEKGYDYTQKVSFSLIERKAGMRVKYDKKPNVIYKFNENKLRWVNLNPYDVSYSYEPIPEEPKEEVPAIAIGDTAKEEPKEVKEEPVVEEIPEEEPEEEEEVVEEVLPEPEKDVFTPVINRNIEAKQKLSELYDEINKAQEVFLRDREMKARSKRHFLEEVSDSRILLKQQERNYQPQ